MVIIFNLWTGVLVDADVENYLKYCIFISSPLTQTDKGA